MAESDPLHVVVTGGAGALGEAVVDAFVAAGRVCHVPLRGRTAPEPRPGVVWATGIDLDDEDAVAGFFASLPPIRASIHVAGGFAAKPFVETSRQDLEAMLRVNLLTCFLCCREAARRMRETGGGAIVNVGSRVSEVPSAGAIAYTISKAAVAAMTRALAEELRPDGIRVNAVLPSVIDTPANRAAMPKADPDRWPKPAEIARTILWLASAESGLVSGALVPVYGSA
jgi:NAD(P)-dependent dehydrogenase (short-subunit alcohol dehydrogenase family)